MDVLEWMAVVTVALGLTLVLRKATARNGVRRLVEGAGLPDEPDLVTAAQAWFQRRQAVVTIGFWLGMMAGGALLLITRSSLDSPLLIWWIAPAVLGGSVATWVESYRMLRTADGGPRAAALRPRRLMDYLSGFEIAIQYGLVAVPLLTAGLGILVLTTADHPGRGWRLVVGGVAAVPLAAVAFFLQRLSLRASHPVGRESELRWREAFRAAMLRDLGMAGIAVSWVLGAAAALSFDWPDDVPGFVEPLTSVVFLGSTFLGVASVLVAMSKHGLRRVVV